MRMAALVHLAAGLPPARARQVVEIIAREGEPETLEAFTRRAAAAFEHDMEPVVEAIVAALHAGSLKDFQDLRALLPHLLRSVNRQPALADLLAHQLGKAMLEGFAEEQRAMGEEGASGRGGDKATREGNMR